MNVAGGQLCSRARFWASLRVDGELSELEGALLDAHLARCADCRGFAAGAELSANALRAAPLARPAPVTLPTVRSPRRFLAAFAAAAVVLVAAVMGGFVHHTVSSTSTSASTAPAVAVVASVETADQLRRLRRASLLNDRPLPRDLLIESF
jgi:predicted anti-sigma-YlaC factor YlaD